MTIWSCYFLTVPKNARITLEVRRPCPVEACRRQDRNDRHRRENGRLQSGKKDEA
jgi:hypothetical protein